MRKIIIALSLMLSVSVTASNFAYITKRPIVSAYLGIWQNLSNADLKRIPFQYFNRIYLSFGKFIQEKDGQWSVAFDANTQNAQNIINYLRNNYPHIQRVLVVGNGNGWSSIPCNANTDDVCQASGAKQFAKNVANFIKNNHLNGFDLDYESSPRNPQDTDGIFNALHRTLTPASEYSILSMDLNPGEKGYIDNNTHQYLTQLNIMAYASDPALSSNVPFYQALNFTNNQLIVALCTENGCSHAAQGHSGGDNLRDIVTKANYVLKNQLGGIAQWRLWDDNALPHPDSGVTDYITPSQKPNFHGAQAMFYDIKVMYVCPYTGTASKIKTPSILYRDEQPVADNAYNLTKVAKPSNCNPQDNTSCQVNMGQTKSLLYCDDAQGSFLQVNSTGNTFAGQKEACFAKNNAFTNQCTPTQH